MKVSAIVVGAFVLLVVIAKLTGLGGSHGPGRHSGAGRPAALSSVDLPVSPGGDRHSRPARASSYR
ncbi:hypothetical protein DMB66_23080 [Actinoplanes sp. ATCC 53533]|uniref:hypothetical protein n=1 Tax=Actinoplanes sp. ATCC 53533 TaxID=1288362 RepID=UPI000F785AC4|nr:hypothetical protein [Actinoplanes sp. ATCC 53533]RSM62046.1 hypothetical protein DMB66_23080 [Actinoplanes sp. ATCC 53533]